MSGFGYSDWSYDPFEKMVIFPPDPLAMTAAAGNVNDGSREEPPPPDDCSSA
jgi:hypothetical protein